MQLGVCYYPEQWPQERWPVDAKLMRQVGISLVRIAEFAWVAMESREDEFTWNWLDQAIEVLAAEGLRVILGTPTASPPPWLCRAHPDVLPVDAQGRRRRSGSRRHYCPNSASYRQHTVRIVTAMASRYGSHPAVVGWRRNTKPLMISTKLGARSSGAKPMEIGTRSILPTLRSPNPIPVTSLTTTVSAPTPLSPINNSNSPLSNR